MNTKITNIKHPCPKGRIAIVVLAQKLGSDTRGYTRFRYISELLTQRGWEVDFICSSFQHWYKAHRNLDDPAYTKHPFNLVFIDEPGYSKNLDLGRIRSHAKAAKNLKAYLESQNQRPYQLIYAQIPPNNITRICAEYAHEHNIPFVADINDLWPEAMRMVVDVPVLSDIAFYPFARDARTTYQNLSACVGTSQEYADRPLLDRADDIERICVYVGNRLEEFDEAVERLGPTINKSPDEFWVSYAGTLGASYDLATLIEAGNLAKDAIKGLRIKILGDGPDRQKLEDLAKRLNAPVDFLGYIPYDSMAAQLAASDVVVNSLVKDAAQSIVTKIGDYLASNSVMINTGSSPEFKAKVDHDGFGFNIEAHQPEALASLIMRLHANPQQCQRMAKKGRMIAEHEFDQKTSYQRIIDLIEKTANPLP